MNVERTMVDGVVVLEPNGDLVGNFGERLDEAVKQEIASGTNQIVLDMTKCRAMDSMGFGTLIGVRQECIQSGCALKLCSLHGRVALPFEKFPKVAELFSIHPTVGEAVSAFVATQG